MKFVPKKTKEKVASVYKTLYIRKELAEQIDIIAKDNHTSFNNVVISMIEACLDDNK